MPEAHLNGSELGGLSRYPRRSNERDHNHEPGDRIKEWFCVSLSDSGSLLRMGKKMPALSEEQLELCYSEFRKHCIRRHGLEEWDTTSYMHLDLENWMLTLIRPRNRTNAIGARHTEKDSVRTLILSSRETT